MLYRLPSYCHITHICYIAVMIPPAVSFWVSHLLLIKLVFSVKGSIWTVDGQLELSSIHLAYSVYVSLSSSFIIAGKPPAVSVGMVAGIFILIFTLWLSSYCCKYHLLSTYRLFTCRLPIVYMAQFNSITWSIWNINIIKSLCSYCIAGHNYLNSVLCLAW